MVSAAAWPIPHSCSSQALAPAASGVRDRLPQRRDLLGQLPGPPGRLALPVRHRRRRAVRVGHPDRARLDPADPPGVGAEQEDVARPALHRPLLVDGADLDLVGFGHDPEVAELGDGPARGQRGQPGAAAALDRSVHLVPVQVVGATAAAGADPLGQQVGDVLEVLGGQVAERRRPPGQAEQLALAPTARRPTRPPSAAPGCPAAVPGPRWRPAGPAACRAAARRTPPARPGWSGTAARTASRCGCGWTGRPAAGRWRSCAASRSGRPAPPVPRRCRAPARRWPPGRAGPRRAAGPRPAACGPGTATRGAPPPERRARHRAVRPAGGRPARPCSGC